MAKSRVPRFDKSKYMDICSSEKSISRRLNDYEIQKTGDLSLHKEVERFTVDKKGTKFFGSLGGVMPTQKTTKTARSKPYYIAHRESTLVDYYVMEVLNAIGQTTAKNRFLIQPNSSGERHKVASKSIEGFMPLFVYLVDGGVTTEDRQDPKIAEAVSTFTFDMTLQKMKNNHTSTYYPISGNMFGTRSAALLVQDIDYSLQNCTLVKRGQRFHFMVIDKGLANLSYTKDYQQLDASIKGKILQEGNPEQELATIYQIHNLIAEEKEGDSKLSKIFFNERMHDVYVKESVAMFLYLFKSIATFYAPTRENLAAERAFGKKVFEEVKKELDRMVQLIIDGEVKIDSIEKADAFIETILKVCWEEPFRKLSAHPMLADWKINFEEFEKKINKFIKSDEWQFNPIMQYQNIKHNAELIVDNCIKNNPDALNDFIKREELRYQIAHQFFSNMKKEYHCEITTDMMENLVEDLRGPYYQSLFTDQENKFVSEKDLSNQPLFDKIRSEFEVEYKELLKQESKLENSSIKPSKNKTGR